MSFIKIYQRFFRQKKNDLGYHMQNIVLFALFFALMAGQLIPSANWIRERKLGWHVEVVWWLNTLLIAPLFLAIVLHILIERGQWCKKMKIFAVHAFNVLCLLLVLGISSMIIIWSWTVFHEAEAHIKTIHGIVLCILFPLTVAISLFFIIHNLALTLKWRVWEDYLPLRPVDWRSVDVARILQEKAPRTGLRYGIIGTGSLGVCILDLLLLRGEDRIFTLDIAPIADKYKDKVTHTCGSVTQPGLVKIFCANVDVVIHTAAVIAFDKTKPNELPPVRAVNVGGTQNVLDGCAANNVKYLIYTSTSHVALEKPMLKKRMNYLTEEDPYSEDPVNHYTRTKVEAEKIVLNHQGTTKTAAIRAASGMFGAYDVLHIEMDLSIGMNFTFAEMIIDWVYVENIAYAHLLAEAGLMNRPEEIAGQAFLVSNEEPMSNVEVRRRLRHFEPDFSIWVLNPYFITFVAHAFEFISRFIELKFFAARYMSMACLDIGRINMVSISKKARRLLGYEPLYTFDESLQKIVDLHDEKKRALAAAAQIPSPKSPN